MNVAPRYTLDAVEAIVTHPEVNIRGLLLTLKLPDWDLARTGFRIPRPRAKLGIQRGSARDRCNTIAVKYAWPPYRDLFVANHSRNSDCSADSRP